MTRLPALADVDVEQVTGVANGLARLAASPFDVLVMSPASTFTEDLDFLRQARRLRPRIRALFLADAATPADVIATMRAEVFAVFTRPFDRNEIANLLVRALTADDFEVHGIQVIGATRDWITLRVAAHVVTAERLVNFMDELHRQLFDEPEMDQLLMAFREILLNAIEHGAGSDASKELRVDAVRTTRGLTFYCRDPGPGFAQDTLAHAAAADDAFSHLKRRKDAGLRPGGYGMLLTRRLVDEVIYSHAGNEVLLVKHLD